MKLALEDFNYDGQHHDRYEIEIYGIDVDEFLNMNKLTQLQIVGKIKEKIKSDFKG